MFPVSDLWGRAPCVYLHFPHHRLFSHSRRSISLSISISLNPLFSSPSLSLSCLVPSHLAHLSLPDFSLSSFFLSLSLLRFLPQVSHSALSPSPPLTSPLHSRIFCLPPHPERTSSEANHDPVPACTNTILRLCKHEVNITEVPRKHYARCASRCQTEKMRERRRDARGRTNGIAEKVDDT